MLGSEQLYTGLCSAEARHAPARTRAIIRRWLDRRVKNNVCIDCGGSLTGGYLKSFCRSDSELKHPTCQHLVHAPCFTSQEEKDAVKNMNQMMLYSKCVTIRDAQIQEKKQMMLETEDETRRQVTGRGRGMQP